ncbi:MAG TPA: pyruvate kinase [Desulfurivibrionaceae bacterium]|nr:pyruvate kinase [Desulfurivibrionaceae bacterium]
MPSPIHRMNRRTRIVATVGPACASAEHLAALIEAGVDVFRLNFSHGTLEEKKRWIATIREIAAQQARPLAILADLQGPKIRTGQMRDGGVMLAAGQAISLTTQPLIGNEQRIPVTYQHLPHDVHPGDRVLIDDGRYELTVRKVAGDTVLCEVVTGGLIRSSKGLNLPGVRVSAPSLTDRDRADLDFCIGQEVDFVALSFVRSPADIEEIKQILYRAGSTIHVIAKIERPEGVDHFDAILAVADGIMVARGDLGVEMSPEKVPLIQKSIIRKCNQAGKPVITATQMLESMLTAPRPTRAETSDVANAILDGSDAVMLSGETAMGAHPLAAVQTMVRVAQDVEGIPPCHANEAGMLPLTDHRRLPEVISQMACRVAENLQVAAILAFTQTGRTAAHVAKYRPSVPIVAVTPSPVVQRKLALYRGVFPFLVEIAGNTETQIDTLERAILDAGLLQKGDLAVVTMGSPVATPGTTNLLKVHRLGTGGFYEVY